MRRTIAFLFTAALVLFSVVGCGTTDSSSSDDGAITVTSSIDGETSTTLNGSSEHTDATTTTTEWKTTTGSTWSNDCGGIPSSATTTPVRTTQPTVTPVSRLPEVKFSAEDSNVRFRDMKNLPNGGFVVCGCRFADDLSSSYAVVQIYDKNSNFLNGYSFKKIGEFSRIAVCSDGGFIVSSYHPPRIVKLNSRFETEWFAPYENEEFWMTVQDIEEISPDLIAVSFVSLNSPDLSRRFKLAFLNKNGGLIETVDLMKNMDQSSSEIIADGNGGFYLLSACNESLAIKYLLVKENYDNLKATEAIIMHFSATRELTWVKILGGGGNDWVEEGAIDNDGNIYLAVGTDWNGADSFWDMSVDKSYLNRRMLVKLNKNGDIIYKAPLSNKTMGVDQVFGIHIKDNKAYVVGMSDYFDGYQEKYPCEQISQSEKGERVFCVYNVCIDGKGEELDREIFRCDINDTPCDSIMLPNGSIVIGGSVSMTENPFNLSFPLGVDSMAALFVYE